MQRYGTVIGVRDDRIEEYKQYHRAVWPEVAERITKCNIRNYSIYLRRMPDGRHYLFSYYEYIGSDYAADMAAMAADAKTQEWWAINKPCQQPLPDCAEGEWWASMEEVFHQD
jgi:L-rhamnose mutarotase